MILFAYSWYDTKLKMYNSPNFLINDGAAHRQVEAMANDPGTEIGKFPNDFSLFKVGSFDTENGVFTPLEGKVHVADANQYIQPQEDIFPNRQDRNNQVG